MTVIRKRGAPVRRAPIKILKVGTPTLPPVPQASPLLAKMRELEERLAKNPDLEHQIALELAAFLARIEHPAPAAKGKAQPAARVVSVTTPSQAHGLRAALGLRNDPEKDRALAQRMTAEARQRVGSADLPDGARPTIVNNLTTTVVTYGPGGVRLPDTPVANALVWQHTYGRYIAAGQRAVTIAPAEVARETGLTVAQVNSAITALEASGQLVRQPNRRGSVPLFAPAQI
jgi:hypothetical protein